MVRQRSAKPSRPSSNLGGASIRTSIPSGMLFFVRMEAPLFLWTGRRAPARRPVQISADKRCPLARQRRGERYSPTANTWVAPCGPVFFLGAAGSARSRSTFFRISHKFRLWRNFTLADAFMRRRAPRGRESTPRTKRHKQRGAGFSGSSLPYKSPAAYNPILPPRGISFRRDACGSSHSVSSIKFLGP